MQKPSPFILLIDDDVDDIEMFSSALEMNGIKVKTFDSSIKALIYLTLMSGNSELPSLIIMDYNMPQKNGLQVLLLIQSNEDTKDIPVVMYSSGMSDLLKEQLSDAGAINCLSKPWSYSELTSQIEMVSNLFILYTKKHCGIIWTPLWNHK